MSEKTYQLEPIVGKELEDCLNKVIIRKEVFDDEYHWPNLCRFFRRKQASFLKMNIL